MKYDHEFKRSFYYETEKAVKDNHICFILGARKCGKTVCMHQLRNTFDNSVYIDMKADFDTDKERRAFADKVIDSIANDEDIIYLIDEAAYMAIPDKDIAKIAGAYSKYNNHNTRVVFSGNPSNALDFWGHIACAGNAAYIRTGFLSYPEWLAYKGLTEVSEKTYLDFLYNVKEFYNDFNGMREYLQGCLDETVISKRSSVEYVLGDSADGLTVDMLLDVLYSSLARLYYPFVDMTAEETGRVSEILDSRYRSFKQMDVYDCKAAMRFLSDCGLITLTYISDELNVDPYIVSKLLKSTNESYKKTEIFERYILTVNYPMFYIDLIEKILKDRSLDVIPEDILGSIVECHVRSLLPTVGAFEYHCNGAKIDHVSVEGRGIEMTVSNKRSSDVNLDLLPDDYKKILLTKDRVDNKDGIQRIPYYQFIFGNSVGTELV